MTKSFAFALLLFSALSCGGSTGETPSTGGAAGAAGATGGTAGATGGTAGSSTGGTAGSSTGGTAGSSGGTAGAACASVSAEFKDALEAAKKCALDSTSPTCTHTVDTSIDGCGYFAFVEGSNTAELAELDSLKGQWKTLGCESNGSCALGGWGPTAATCKSPGLGGAFGVCTPN